MPASQDDGNKAQGESTIVSQSGTIFAVDLRVPALTVLAHPAAERVGERVLLPALMSGRTVLLSRLEPLFAQPGSGATRPLDDPHVSRQPFALAPAPAGGLRVSAPPGVKLELFGEAAAKGGELARADLERGVPLLLGGRVALLLHLLSTVQRPSAETHGLAGESAAMAELRSAIGRGAGLEVPTLLRGETGTGKELVARALHRASPRRQGPYLAMNLAAVPAALAAAELFGAARGAFTGADRRREGYFERADGGTLFLDEIGEASAEVQALLLRVLETGEIQTVGESPRRVDVRVIAATDAPLEKLVADGRFRAPLLHRLEAYRILLPPLRERRDDIGRLLQVFLREELSAAAAAPGPVPSRLPARLVAGLAAADWPGNVRELRNFARRLAGLGGEIPAELPADLAAALALPSASPSWPASPEEPVAGPVPATLPRRRRRALAELPESEILAALREASFNLTAAAARLGLSRTVLDGFVDRHPALRKASHLGREEIAAELEQAGGDLEAAAARLGVSPHGLRLRRGALGIL